MSNVIDISTSFAADGTVTVASGGTTMVGGGNFSALSMTTAADGTIAFEIGGTPVQPTGGSLAGASLALQAAANAQTRLDSIADSISGAVNAAQAAGVALDGSPGQPIFGGTGAAAISVVMTDSGGIATAPAGAAAGSLDGANLAALRAALDDSGAANAMNGLLFDTSSAVSGRRVTRDALESIAASARISLEAQSGVDLDTEAANLLRFQQAFQASGRAMQVASRIFDTLLELR